MPFFCFTIFSNGALNLKSMPFIIEMVSSRSRICSS